MKCSALRMSASGVPGSAASSKQSWMRLRSAMVSLISCARVRAQAQGLGLSVNKLIMIRQGLTI